MPTPNHHQDQPMIPSQRRDLIRRGHTLSPQLAVGRQGLTDSLAAQAAEAMKNRDLLKVRIEAESGDEATQLAEELAAKVGARVIQRVGRIALLYKKPVEQGDDA
jgi:RNA-binding protein